MIYSTFGNVRESTEPKTDNISTLTDNGNVLGGVYQMTPLVRKVYAAAILVTVLGQERGLVPSEDFPKPPFP